jgi:hypothetical protein
MMDASTTNSEQKKIGPRTQAACDIASGRVAPDADPAPAGQLTVAKRDYSATGARREYWYRMRLTNGAWQYLGDRRLSQGTYYASALSDAVRADVYAGDLLIKYNHGGPVDSVAGLVVGRKEETGKIIVADCPVVKRRDGQLAITLPDGSVIVAVNPRQ